MGAFPEIVEDLLKRLNKLEEQMVPADDLPENEKGDPKFWSGNFSPGWCIAK